MLKQPRSMEHEVSTPPDDDVHSITLRYDSPRNQALSCIQDLLEQDDHVAPDGSSLSFGELLAYHAKASELAALLKEDSPALSLKWTLASQDGAPSASEQEPSFSQPPVYPQDAGVCLNSDDQASESFCNRVVLMSRLKGAQRFYSMPSKALDVSLFRNLASKSLSLLEQANTGAADDEMGASHQPPRRSDALKPRKDLSIAKPRFHETYSDRSTGKARFTEHVDSGLGRMGRIHVYVDLNDLLLGCARAVGSDNTKSAIEIVSKVKVHASPYGNGAERLAYYFVEALHARFSGTGWPIYTGDFKMQRPSIREVLMATFMYLANCPFAKASYVFANQTILKVAKGASTLHIIEHQITSYRYPSLFKELAALPGGPPKVHVVGLVVPHYSMLPASRDVFYEELEKIGRRLAKCAASYGVPFYFTPWVGTRETIRLQDFVSPKRNPDEVLVLISACFVRFVMDDMLDARSVRIKNFKMMHDMNPDVYIQGVITGSYSTPFYSMRFKEALFHFASIYELLDTFIERDNAARVIFESEVLGKAILNVVACEGLAVSARVDKYKEWQATTEEVGMQQLPIDREIAGNVEDVLRSWHKEYTIAEDRKYLLMGWKGRILYAMSTWKSSIKSK